MKRYLFLISILTVSVPGITRADEIIPKRMEFNRYAAMVEKSPFAVASAPAQVSTVAAWSKDLFIANAAHMPEVDLVTVNSLSDKNLREYLTTETANEHGYAIASIEWSENPGATKVTISKDGQFATLGFNEAIMSQAPSIPNAPYQNPNIPGQNPNIPGAPNGRLGAKPGAQPGAQPGVQPGAQQPMAVPPALPAPHVRGVIQRKPPQGTPSPNTAPLTAPES
jgi:hypothetical protein